MAKKLTTHEIDIYVGKRLKMARVLRDMTQSVLGSKIGVTLQQIQKYERGCNRVSASKLFLMARALRVDVGYFYKGYVEEGSEVEEAVLDDIAESSLQTLSDGEALVVARLYSRITSAEARKALLNLAKSLGAPSP